MWDDSPTFQLISCPLLSGSGGDPFGAVLVSIGLIGAEQTHGNDIVVSQEAEDLAAEIESFLADVDTVTVEERELVAAL